MKVSSTLVILSILLTALSGLAAIVSAEDQPLAPNMFYGNVSLNSEWAPLGTVIEAYIDDEPRGNVTITREARYGSLAVRGSESDEGKTITFKVGGLDADRTAVWHASSAPEPSEKLDLHAGPAPTTPAPAYGGSGGGGSGGSGLPTTTSTDENASSVSGETESSSTSPTEPTTSAAETTATPEAPGAESDDDSGFLSGFGMILAVIVVAGIIVAVYLVSKRS
ncbi:MAG: hypothetical protein ACXQTY_04625 [Candidatus Methanogasteraceae archaeon]